MNFNRIKKNYDTGLFNAYIVRRSYEAGIINLVEYYCIIGSVEDTDVPEGMTKEELIELLIKTAKELGIWQ